MFLLFRFTTWIDRLSHAGAWVGRWLVLLCCVVSAVNAILRYAFSISANSWLEIQWYMFAGMVMLGGPYTLKVNEHIRIDLFYGRLGARGRILVDLLGFTLFFFPLITLLTWLSWRFFLPSWHSQEASNNVGGLLLWPAKLLLPVGFGLLLLQGVAEFIKRIAALRSAYELDTHYEKPAQ